MGTLDRILVTSGLLLIGSAAISSQAHAAPVCWVAPNGAQVCGDDGTGPGQPGGGNSGGVGIVDGGGSGSPGAVPPPPAQAPYVAAPAPAPYLPPAPVSVPYVPAPVYVPPTALAPAPAAPARAYNAPSAPAPVRAAPIPAAGQVAVRGDQPVAPAELVVPEAAAAAESDQGDAYPAATPMATTDPSAVPVAVTSRSVAFTPVQDIEDSGTVFAASQVYKGTVSSTPVILAAALVSVGAFAVVVFFRFAPVVSCCRGVARFIMRR